MALRLWSKLDSVDDVISPQVGTGGEESGSPTYEPAKFDNGIYSDIPDEGCWFPTADNNINLNMGRIEFWVKLKFSMETEIDHSFFAFRLFGYGGIIFFYWVHEKKFDCVVFSGGEAIKVLLFDLSWAVGDLIHFKIMWDRQGINIDGSKTLAVYVNDVEKASTTTKWATDSVLSHLEIGYETEGGISSGSVIDDLKVYDHCKILVEPVEPTDLLCEQKRNPTDVVDPQPEFSAIYHS